MTERGQPWDEPTTEQFDRPTSPANRAYRPGVAQVGHRPHPTAPIVDPALVGPGWTDSPARPRPPWRYQARQLRRGWEWSNLGGLFAFVCWGTWAVSEGGTSIVVPFLAFVLVLLVAVGVFALSRLLGRVILERWLGRIRRSAWPSHLVTGMFLAAAGVEYLRRTEWIVDGISWLRGLS